jgi:hypothetical protein
MAHYDDLHRLIARPAWVAARSTSEQASSSSTDTIMGYFFVFGFVFLMIAIFVLGATGCFEPCRRRIAPKIRTRDSRRWEDVSESGDGETVIGDVAVGSCWEGESD